MDPTSMDPTFHDLLCCVAACPGLSSLSYQVLTAYISLARRYWDKLATRTGHPRKHLPDDLASTFSQHLSISKQAAIDAWSGLRTYIAKLAATEPLPSEDDRIRMHARSDADRDTIAPPVKRCIHPGCKSNLLSDSETYEARRYTFRRGVLPVTVKTLYCRLCHTRYYKDYYVHHASEADSMREYYDYQVPQIIQAQLKAFIDAELCEQFCIQFKHKVTAQSIATIYNETHGLSEIPNASSLKREISAAAVYDSFFLHRILVDRNERKEVLVVPHAGKNRTRYNNVLKERNRLMAGTGQEHWSHTCNLCTLTYVGEDGNPYEISAAVTDGVTLGHPCCSVRDCHIPLAVVKDRYCPTHDHINSECVVIGCSQKPESGHLTCTSPAHREYEIQHKASSNTKRQREVNKRAARGGDVLDAETLDDVDCEDGTSEGSKPPPKKKVRGRWTRTWTHNEQLVVRCCGIILSRATFFGSEAVSSTVELLKATFPKCWPGCLLSYIFYDNNCNLRKHLVAQDDHYFDDCGMPIDVFHYKTGTHKLDPYCTLYCDPRNYPEIRNDKNQWIFNTSVAEQVNAWFGGYQNIVREMPADRYNFFLDEMIAIHNRKLAGKLAEAGHCPRFIPEEILLAPRVLAE